MFKKILFTSLFCQLASAELMPYYTDQEAVQNMAEHERYYTESSRDSDPEIAKYVIAYTDHAHIINLFKEIKAKVVTDAGYDASNLSPNQQKLIDFRWKKIQDYLESAVRFWLLRNDEKRLDSPEDITLELLLDVLSSFEFAEKYQTTYLYMGYIDQIHELSKNKRN